MAMRKIDWTPILADYQTGQYSLNKLAEKHNVSKGALSYKLKEVDKSLIEQSNAVIKGFDDSIEQLEQLRLNNPQVAEKVIDIVTQKHPEFKKAMVALSSKLFNRMLQLAPEATANEIPALAKGMQTITDTLGISQRHANSQINVTSTSAVQNNTTILTHEQMREELRRRGLPIEL